METPPDALRHPVIAGAIASLVGPNPRFDHRAAHLVPARSERGPNLHQDAEYDARHERFDIQLSLFLHDVPAEMGGTMFIPGSHFRCVRVFTPTAITTSWAKSQRSAMRAPS